MVKKGMKYTRTQSFHDATRHMTYLLVSFFVKPSSFLQFSNRNTRADEGKVKKKKKKASISMKLLRLEFLFLLFPLFSKNFCCIAFDVN